MRNQETNREGRPVGRPSLLAGLSWRRELGSQRQLFLVCLPYRVHLLGLRCHGRLALHVAHEAALEATHESCRSCRGSTSHLPGTWGTHRSRSFGTSSPCATPPSLSRRRRHFQSRHLRPVHSRFSHDGHSPVAPVCCRCLHFARGLHSSDHHRLELLRQALNNGFLFTSIHES